MTEAEQKRPSGPRVVIGISVLGVALAAFAAFVRREPREYGDLHGRVGFRRFESSRECSECHGAIAAAWRASAHATAAAEVAPRNAPRPVLDTGAGEPPLMRRTRWIDGVDCLSCHERSGRIAGSHDNPAAACKPVTDARLASRALCTGCHDVPDAEVGTCTSCHDHGLRSSAAVRLDAKAQKDHVAVTVQLPVGCHPLPLGTGGSIVLEVRKGGTDWRRARSFDAPGQLGAKAFRIERPATGGIGLRLVLGRRVLASVEVDL